MKMDSKYEDVLIVDVDIDPAVLLSYELDKLNLCNQLDVEDALLSVEDDNLPYLTTHSEDLEAEHSNTSILNIVSVTSESTRENESEVEKDINGNEPSSDESLNESFLKLELSDSDNEEKDDEESAELRERGPIKRRPERRPNRPNYVERNKRYDKSQFPPGSLNFLAGSTLLQSPDSVTTAYQFTPQNYEATSMDVFTLPSNDLSNFFPVYEDHLTNTIGSPESGYESSITGSPPRVSLPTAVSPNLDLNLVPDLPEEHFNFKNIPEGYESSLSGSPSRVSLSTAVSPNLDSILAPDLPEEIGDFIIQESALPYHYELNYNDDNKDPEKKIKEIEDFLKGPPKESNGSSDAIASGDSRDNVPLTNNSQDTENGDLEKKNKEIEHILKGLPKESSGSSDAIASDDSRDNVPLTNNSQDTNTQSGTLIPESKNVERLPKIEFELENKARKALRDTLPKEKVSDFEVQIFRQLQIKDTSNNRDFKVIHLLDEKDKATEGRTNLHQAVLKNNTWKIYCLVEIHKMFNKHPSDVINMRDKYGKTALDYAIQRNMTIVIEYLKENLAVPSINFENIYPFQKIKV